MCPDALLPAGALPPPGRRRDPMRPPAGNDSHLPGEVVERNVATAVHMQRRFRTGLALAPDQSRERSAFGARSLVAGGLPAIPPNGSAFDSELPHQHGNASQRLFQAGRECGIRRAQRWPGTTSDRHPYPATGHSTLQRRLAASSSSSSIPLPATGEFARCPRWITALA